MHPAKRISSVALIVIASLAIVAAASGGPTSALVTGKVNGTFHRNCLACGDSAKYIAATSVWCGWRNGQVAIHVKFKNRSVEGLKVTWHPSYVIRNGSEHGGGLTSLQDTKLKGGQTRDVIVQQSPKDTPSGSAIAICKPSFYLVGH